MRPRPRLTIGVSTADKSDQLINSQAEKPKILFAVGVSWANPRDDNRGVAIDLTTTGTLSVGYYF